MKLRFVAPLLTLSGIVYPAHALALWQTNGVPLSTATNHQEWPAITTDGAGGAIVAWSDKRSGIFDVYVQRVNAMGVVQWTPNGVALCTANNAQINVTIVSDDAAGAIVTWQDYRSGTNHNIYAQHVNAAGLVQWVPNGIALCTAPNDQRYPVPATDGAGGAIVAWDDLRNGDLDIYAQRINAAGVVQWMGDGVELCTQPFIQYLPAILSDSAGGAFVTWPDFRNGTDYDIYGQRVDALGSVLWADDGVPICAAAQNSAGQTMAPDDAGGAIVTWEDLRNGPDWDVFAQRIDAAGNVMWTADGEPISLALDDQFAPTIASDGAGGAIVTWEDLRAPFTGRDIYAQRINSLGAVQWTTDGVPLCVIRGVQTTPKIAPDGSNGAIVTWWDIRSNIDYDIYVQRVNASGTALWTTHGVALCVEDENQISPKIVSDGGAGAIVTWHDERSITSYDVYAQRIGPNGLVPTPVGDTPSFAGVSLSANFPNPFSDQTSMDLDLSADATVEVDVHDVAGRLVRRVRSLHASAGLHRMSFDGRDGAGRPLASGVYFYSVHAGGETRTRKLIISR